ncbi:hypothetical protein [Streptomyces montanus]|uniref:hypothetical protein n=1 Tax=Streptomyces montanus TaxID=2580423 RepID=UPI001FEB81DD|nr:hypothetical protein [Streptomyces montanus]
MPAALGFATIAVLLLLTMVKRASVLVALILLPVPAALIGSFAGDLGELILGGLSNVAATGIVIAFPRGGRHRHATEPGLHPGRRRAVCRSANTNASSSAGPSPPPSS